ncbi:MAG: Uma2 family endonuclease [Candidatus Xenobia bacterium]
MLERARRWTREEYERASAAGVFQPDERLELIDGVIVRKMVQGVLHVAGVRKTQSVLQIVFGAGYDVRPQMPLALDPDGEPEPDVAVVLGSIEDYMHAHPTTAVLVVEVADTSLAVDRGSKASIYARAGIGEYWILNLVDRLLEVHREPAALEQPFGHQYRSIVRLGPEASIAPLAAPEHVLRVADLLP